MSSTHSPTISTSTFSSTSFKSDDSLLLQHHLPSNSGNSSSSPSGRSMKERVAPLVRELYLKVKQFSENLDQLQGILSLSSSQKSSTIQENQILVESTEVSHQIEILFKQLENSFQSIPSTTEDYNHGLIKKIHRLQSRFQGRLLNFSSLCQTIHHQNDQLLLESNKINISGKIIQIHPATQESISLQENHSTFNPPSQGDLEASTLDLKQQQALSPPPTKEAGDDLFHEALVRDREVAIQDLHEAVIDIHDLFMDLSTLVDEQHYLVDHIEGNMENVGMYTEDTLAQLIAGHRRRRKYSWRKNICYMILGVVLVLFVLSIVMSII